MAKAVDKLSPNPAEIAQRLRERFGTPAHPKRRGLVAGLVRTILSQNTTAANAERAYRRLRKRFSAWDQLAQAPLAEIEDAIRPAGLARPRARAIKASIASLLLEDPSLRLRHLRSLPTPELIQRLRALPGVGPKTAACVALFELGRPVFPVDTHIARISRRLGWAAPGATAEAIQVAVEPLIPPALRLELHLNLIALGRAICRPRAPACCDCPLANLCPSAVKVQ